MAKIMARMAKIFFFPIFFAINQIKNRDCNLTIKSVINIETSEDNHNVFHRIRALKKYQGSLSGVIKEYK